MENHYNFEEIEKKWPSSAKATEGKQVYDFKTIENKWQTVWSNRPIFKAEDFSTKPKHYHLIEFPYPSGAGLHVGHCMGYGASDAYSRMKRMQGFNVLFPMGWDAFGLPTENYAIKSGKKPALVTKENSDIFRRQMKSLGLSFDWDREVNTSDPAYFKWTQWIFLQFYKHAIVDNKLIEVSDDDTTTPRLAYQAEMPINWCPSCKIGLANEEVVAGKCERCGSEVSKKMQKQWMLRITAYADRLIKDLDDVDYLESIKTQQINWIGRSEGTNVRFEIKNQKSKIKIKEASPRPDYYIEVFTTRADTLFGCTYIVLAPEHPLLENLKFKIQNLKEVEQYIAGAKKKSDMERTELAKDKTGVKLEGIKAINPINNEEVDIYVADYVLANYGTGAVMAVPAHDERDYEFAKKYNIPIKEVIIPERIDKRNPPVAGKEKIERKNVQAIVKDSKTGKFLCLHSKKHNWNTFPMGGINDNEDVVAAAKREVSEETGYTNLINEKILGGPVRAEYFAKHKDQNRVSFTSLVYFELGGDDKIEIAPEEQGVNDILWIEPKNMNVDFMVHAEMDIWLDWLNNPKHAFCDYGILTNSEEFDGLSSEEGKKKITEKLKTLGAGDFTINYKLRDWIFSRQHYWGEPIPIIYCRKCWGSSKGQVVSSKENSNTTIIDGEKYMLVPMNENDLPLTLPDVENYQPTNDGQSPLSKISDWVNVKCPKCGGEAKRETDTMPNWAGSSWYFLAYAMQENTSRKLKVESRKGDTNIFLENKEQLKYWMSVDLYNGGNEHTTLHLLYSRFWNKFLFDLGVVPSTEPYQKRIAHGIILGADGRKMSKSFGNVINPDDIVKKYGADTTRAYIMFIGPYDTESAWNMAGVAGVSRFLNRVYKNFNKMKANFSDSTELLIKTNQSIAGITDDLENFRLNTVVSKLMELNNTIEKSEGISKQLYEIFIQLLFPVAPHLASELWELIGNNSLLDLEKWPLADKKYLVADEIEIVVQINGKVRDKLMVPSDILDKDLESAAFNSEKIKENIKGKEIIKTIVVSKKLVSIVINE